MTCSRATLVRRRTAQLDRRVGACGFVVVLLTLVGFAGSAAGGGRATEPQNAVPTTIQSADWKSKPISWTDIQTLPTGGRLVYHATNIRRDRDRFVIAASVTNRSPRRVSIHVYAGADPAGYVRPLSFGLAYRQAANPNITTRRLSNIRATTFAPQLPPYLDPGQTWKGTFSGRSPRLREHHDWWIVYGVFDPGGYWISDKSFST
jgi:hypothetical protein